MTAMHGHGCLAAVVATTLGLGLGCSGGSAAGDCDGGRCRDSTAQVVDAATDSGGETETGGDAGAWDESNVWDAVLAGDSGLADSGRFGGPLQVDIDIQGQGRSCGSCAVLLADIRGGMPPYEVTWSDPSLEGYGPHEVCTDESVEYTLQVTDSGPDGEFARAQTAEATATATCEERTQETGFTGCRVLLEGSVFTALEGPSEDDLERQYGCESLDGSEGIPGSELYPATMQDADAGPPTLEASGLVIPAGGFRAGETYQLSLALLFGIQLGGDVRAEIWGSEVGCSRDEKLGELRLRSEDLGHADFCFTPKQDFEKVVMVTGEDTVNPAFGFSLGISISACDSCD